MHHGYTPTDAIFASMPDRTTWLAEQHSRYLETSDPILSRWAGRVAKTLRRASATLGASVGLTRGGALTRTASNGA